MSSVASPFGLRPAQPLSGAIRPREGTIESGQAGNIFQYNPVGINATGFLVNVTPTVLATTGAIVGVFLGVEFTGTDGRRRVLNNWPDGQVGADIVAYYTIDESIVYEAQSSAPITQALIGDLFNPSGATSGNAITGLSNLSVAAAANGSLRCIGVNPGPDNIVGDAFTVGQFLINKHQVAPIQAAIA